MFCEDEDVRAILSDPILSKQKAWWRKYSEHYNFEWRTRN